MANVLEFKWRYYSDPAEHVTALELEALALTSETVIKIALSEAVTGRPESMQYMSIIAMRRPGGTWVPTPR